VLYLRGRYAYTLSPERPTRFALGEGLVGQAAQDGKMCLLEDISESQFIIASGLGESVLRYVFVAPFIYMGDVRGVLELGAQHAFAPEQVAFVEQTLEPIAIAFNTAQNLAHINALLNQTRSQAEELRRREEELRVINEDLRT
jgi:hypothetical protein